MNDHDIKPGKFAYNGLERILHEKSRLSIMTSLFTCKTGHSFNELKELCSLTDGNLSRHIKVLKEAGLVTVTKSFEDNKPVTHCVITGEGREKYREYLIELEHVIKDALKNGNMGSVNNNGFQPA